LELATGRQIGQWERWQHWVGGLLGLDVLLLLLELLVQQVGHHWWLLLLDAVVVTRLGQTDVSLAEA